MESPLGKGCDPVRVFAEPQLVYGVPADLSDRRSGGGDELDGGQRGGLGQLRHAFQTHGYKGFGGRRCRRR